LFLESNDHINNVESYAKFAQYYDEYVGNFTADIPLYLNSVEEGAKILEVGCGTGRVLKPLLDAGCIVTGVDISPDMLDIAEKRLSNYIDQGKLHILEYNLCNNDIPIELDVAFDSVFITFYTFNYIINDLEVERLMEHIYHLMQPGGVIIIDLFYPMSFSKPELEDKWTEKTLLLNGHRVKLHDRRKVNGDIEVRVQRYISEDMMDTNAVDDIDEIVSRRRVYTKSYIHKVHKDIGFKDIQFTDGYDTDGFHSLREDEKESCSYVVKAYK